MSGKEKPVSEIPPPFRHIFPYSFFNAIQSGLNFEFSFLLSIYSYNLLLSELNICYIHFSDLFISFKNVLIFSFALIWTLLLEVWFHIYIYIYTHIHTNTHNFCQSIDKNVQFVTILISHDSWLIQHPLVVERLYASN
jgi:hypothetical protein